MARRGEARRGEATTMYGWTYIGRGSEEVNKKAESAEEAAGDEARLGAGEKDSTVKGPEPGGNPATEEEREVAPQDEGEKVPPEREDTDQEEPERPERAACDVARREEPKKEQQPKQGASKLKGWLKLNFAADEAEKKPTDGEDFSSEAGNPDEGDAREACEAPPPTLPPKGNESPEEGEKGGEPSVDKALQASTDADARPADERRRRMDEEEALRKDRIIETLVCEITEIKSELQRLNRLLTITACFAGGLLLVGSYLISAKPRA